MLHQLSSQAPRLVVSQKLNLLLPYDLAIVVLSIYLRGLKNLSPHKTPTWMFIATLFIIANSGKQPRCPLVGEGINKLRYIQTMEYYLVLKTNELPNQERRGRIFFFFFKGIGIYWIHCKAVVGRTAEERLSARHGRILKCILLSKRNKSQKGKTMETVKRSAIVRGGRDE